MPAASTAPPEAPPLERRPLDYRVRVENYFGPLDLLLYLVKESEVDITRLSLARIADQYIAYITAMQKLDLEVAGEFLAVASQLLLIKTRTLVPPEPGTEEAEALKAEEDADTSVELIRKLLEYRRFKERARALGRLYDERGRRAGRPRLRLEGEDDQQPLRDMEVWDLVLAYARLMKSTRLDAPIEILYEDLPIEAWIDTILRTLAERRSIAFSDLVGAGRDRSRTVGTFLAMLQLARDQRLRLVQDADLKDIRLEAVDPSSENPAPPPAS